MILVSCKHYAVKQGHDIVTFGDLAKHTFGRAGLVIVDVLLIFTQVGVCCVYVGMPSILICTTSRQRLTPSSCSLCLAESGLHYQQCHPIPVVYANVATILDPFIVD